MLSRCTLVATRSAICPSGELTRSCRTMCTRSAPALMPSASSRGYSSIPKTRGRATFRFACSSLMREPRPRAGSARGSHLVAGRTGRDRMRRSRFPAPECCAPPCARANRANRVISQSSSWRIAPSDHSSRRTRSAETRAALTCGPSAKSSTSGLTKARCASSASVRRGGICMLRHTAVGRFSLSSMNPTCPRPSGGAAFAGNRSKTCEAAASNARRCSCCDVSPASPRNRSRSSIRHP